MSVENEYVLKRIADANTALLTLRVLSCSIFKDELNSAWLEEMYKNIYNLQTVALEERANYVV